MKALSLFSGIGGIDLAAEWAGIETVAFCEREPFCQKVLAKHWPAVPIYDDVCTLTKERLEADGIGTIELIHGGYPCQPFSVAGKREGAEDDRHLWPEVFRLLQEIKPKWFIGENVAGHVTLGLDIVLSDLESIGYTWEAFVIPACAVNAPHRRDRVFIVAHAESINQRGLSFRTSETHTGFTCSCKNVAHAQGERCGETRELRHNGNEEWVAGSGENVSNTASKGLSIGGQSGFTESQTKTGTRMEPKSERCSKNVANSEHNGDVRGIKSLEENEQFGTGGNHYGSGTEGHDGREWWAVESNVGRVANGIPQRVDRLKALGNAVVPQQIYPILAAIKQINDLIHESEVSA